MIPVQVSTKHKRVAVPHAEAVQNLFPNATPIDLGGIPHLLPPQAPADTVRLRRMGFDVPAPIMSQYDWAGGTPFEVQRKMCAMLTMNQRAYVLNDMGTGKTKAALWAWDYLRSNNLAGKLLVAA